MKLYNEEGRLVIDGERDFTICNNREFYIGLSKDVKKITICNHYMCMVSKSNKLRVLWLAIKFIFWGKYDQRDWSCGF
ncbi:hypothetical protein ES695_11585 [Candidatus Atribacteria bacterium 1244-E10-H5-B2]|nr:MAG: hypothetical protein ES695_11585 [Candidatus Atribacteria bacterium 1244-E10-H5-B2]